MTTRTLRRAKQVCGAVAFFCFVLPLPAFTLWGLLGAVLAALALHVWDRLTTCALCDGSGISPTSEALKEAGLLPFTRPCGWCHGTGRGGAHASR